MGVWRRSIARKEGIWQQNINATRSKNWLKNSLSSYLFCRMMGSLSSFVWYDDFKNVSNQPNEYIDQDVLTKFNVWQAVQENRLNPFSLIAKKIQPCNISKISIAIGNPGVSPVQLPNKYGAVNSSWRGEQRWSIYAFNDKSEPRRRIYDFIGKSEQRWGMNNSIMAKSPMKDLLAWWQNAKLRIRKYDVVVDERGGCQRICEDWRSTLFTSSCHQVRKEFSLYQLSSAPTLTKPLLLLLLPQLLLALLNHRRLLR